MMRKLLIVSAALLLSAVSANAASVAYTVDAASFTGTVGGSNRTASSSGDDASLRWGVDVGYGRSGFFFNGLDGTVNLEPGETRDFTFGEFTHRNQPIESGSGIDRTNLNFSVTILGVTIPVSLRIDHNETANNANFSCCADIVNVAGLNAVPVQQGALSGFISIVPFLFTTPERNEKLVAFKGQLSLDRIPEIPLPPAALLFASGLAGIGFLRKKRKL